MSLNPDKLSYNVKEACAALSEEEVQAAKLAVARSREKPSALLIPGKLSYTIDEAAALLGATRRRVQSQVDRGRVASFVMCGRRLLRPAAVEALRERFSHLDRKTATPRVGVYLLFLKGALTYIGRSTNLPARLQTHRRSGRTFDRIEIIACDASTADWLEPELIRTLRPPQNVVRYERRTRIAAQTTAGLG